MTGENLIVAVIVCVAMIGSYLWGYRDGVAYCVRELGPFRELLKSLREERKKP